MGVAAPIHLAGEASTYQRINRAAGVIIPRRTGFFKSYSFSGIMALCLMASSGSSGCA